MDITMSSWIANLRINRPVGMEDDAWGESLRGLVNAWARLSGMKLNDLELTDVVEDVATMAQTPWLYEDTTPYVVTLAANAQPVPFSLDGQVPLEEAPSPPLRSDMVMGGSALIVAGGALQAATHGAPWWSVAMSLFVAVILVVRTFRPSH